MKTSLTNRVKNVALTVGLSAGMLTVGTVTMPQKAEGTVPADVQTAINDSIATVQALSPLALAALAVALIPFGSMLALKFLNMVMARL